MASQCISQGLNNGLNRGHMCMEDSYKESSSLWPLAYELGKMAR